MKDVKEQAAARVTAIRAEIEAVETLAKGTEGSYERVLLMIAAELAEMNARDSAAEERAKAAEAFVREMESQLMQRAGSVIGVPGIIKG